MERTLQKYGSYEKFEQATGGSLLTKSRIWNHVRKYMVKEGCLGEVSHTMDQKRNIYADLRNYPWMDQRSHLGGLSSIITRIFLASYFSYGCAQSNFWTIEMMQISCECFSHLWACFLIHICLFLNSPLLGVPKNDTLPSLLSSATWRLAHFHLFISSAIRSLVSDYLHQRKELRKGQEK